MHSNNKNLIQEIVLNYCKHKTIKLELISIIYHWILDHQNLNHHVSCFQIMYFLWVSLLGCIHYSIYFTISICCRIFLNSFDIVCITIYTTISKMDCSNVHKSALHWTKCNPIFRTNCSDLDKAQGHVEHG